MYCPNCGAPNRDDVSFCASCGTRLAANNTQQTPYSSAPVVTTPAPEPVPVYTSVYSSSYSSYATSATIVPKIKNLAGSPLMLIAAIAYTVGTLFSVMSSFISAGYMGEEVTALTFLTMIPSIICFGFVISGLWHIFVQGKSAGDSFGTFGLGAIKGICVFNIVLTALVGGIVAFIMFGAMIGVSSYGGADGAEAVLAVGLIISIAVMVIMILFFSKASSSLGGVKNAVVYKTPYNSSASAFVAVMCFFVAAGLLFYALFYAAGIEFFDSLLYELGPEVYSMFSLYDSSAIVLTMISNFSNVVAYVMFGILIFKYNSIINDEYSTLYR